MIELPNGVKFGNIMLDCVLGHSGSGIWQYKLASPAYRRLIRTITETETVVGAKSATEPGRIGNYRELNPFTWFRYVKKIENRTGIQNAIGLTNRGVKYCALSILDSIELGIDVKPNLYIDFSKGIELAIQNTQRALEIYALILGDYFDCLIKNDSCPNSGENITKTIKYNAILTEWIKKQTGGKIAIIEKVSIVHPFEMLEELERRGADAIMGVNSIPFAKIYPDKKSPMWRVGGGGISGAPALKQAYAYNKEARRHVKIQYLMGCGIMSKEDILAYQDIGADTCVICSWASLYPSKVADALEEFNG
jgi:dihydroorotate dehydrogenase